DFEFARAFDLPIPAIQQPPDSWFAERSIEPTLDTSTWPEAFIGDAPYVNSSNGRGLDLDGLSQVVEGKRLTNAWLEANDRGYGPINFKLRAWLFSRQRYWGEPFPIVYDEYGPIGLPEDTLPVVLPETDSFSPRTFDPDDEFSNPESPLDRLEWWNNV